MFLRPRVRLKPNEKLHLVFLCPDGVAASQWNAFKLAELLKSKRRLRGKLLVSFGNWGGKSLNLSPFDLEKPRVLAGLPRHSETAPETLRNAVYVFSVTMPKEAVKLAVDALGIRRRTLFFSSKTIFTGRNTVERAVLAALKKKYVL